MTIKIEHGAKSKAAIDALKRLNAKTNSALIQSFNQIGKQLMTTSKQLILDKNKSGRIYYNVPYSSTGKKGGTLVKKKHQASAPGQAPANLSGRLYKSLNYTRQGAQSITFGNSAPYARKLELGEDNVSPRPFLITSINDNKRDIENIFQETIKIEISNIGT